MALVSRLVGSQDAEDAIQETWIRACDALARFRWHSAFGTWVTAIAVNVSRDLLRRHGRSLLVPTDEPPEVPIRPGDAVSRMDLEQSIARLPDGYRQVLVLHDVEGMKHREIAEALGITAGASKSQLFAARRAMRNLLGTKYGE
jgi:RNA polymerase sigma-70 factor (ECF subfamily)